MKPRSNLVIGLALIILATLIGVLAWANAPRSREAATLTVMRGGAVLQAFTLEQIQKMPSVELAKNIQSANHTDERGVYRGVELRVLLDQAVPDWPTSSSQIIARAADGYTATFAPDEIGFANNIVIVYAKDGLPLGSLTDGGSGPFRIIIREDAFGTRGTKYLIEIEVG